MSAFVDVVKLATDKSAQAAIADLVAKSAGIYKINLGFNFISVGETKAINAAAAVDEQSFLPNAGSTGTQIFYGSARLGILITAVTAPAMLTVFVNQPNYTDIRVFYGDAVSSDNPLVPNMFVSIDIPPVPWSSITVYSDSDGLCQANCYLLKNGLFIQ